MHDALDSTRFKNGTPENVFLIAFKGTGNKMVIVAINKGSAATVPIAITGGTVPASFIPYVTTDGNNKNWAEGSTVSGGRRCSYRPARRKVRYSVCREVNIMINPGCNYSPE